MLELLLFFLSILFILILPGYFLILAIFRDRSNIFFIPLEKLTIAFAVSIVFFDFLVIFLDKLNILLNRTSILISLISFFACCFILSRYLNNFHKNKNFLPKNSLSFSKKQQVLIILILFLTFFIKTVYLKDAIFPTATDLGHHMYWSKLISQTGELPEYQKNEIIKTENSYEMKSEKIADFIIGEHLIFSGINILTKIPFNSYFPALVLFLINIFSLLSIFILSLRLFENKKYRNLNPVHLSILVLFLVGPLYAITSPQAKFVSGGVIGNLLGNLFIPLCLYFYFRAIKEKNSWLLFIGILLSAGMFYTHHLSGFIFIFIFIFIFVVFNLFFIIGKLIHAPKNKMALTLKAYQKFSYRILSIFFTPQIIVLIISILLFLFFVYTPSYLAIQAQTEVLGAPSKSTRAGLTLEQFKYAVGEMRLALGLIGLIVISYLMFIKKHKFGINHLLSISIILGWGLALFLMTVYPQKLHINIPSDRIANYANFPFIFLAAFGLFFLIYILKNIKFSTSLISFVLMLFFSTTIFGGHYDNSQALTDGQKKQKALQTFHLSQFLSEKTKNINYLENNILKDHNYISADSWIKTFFLKDYNYPLSRGYFKRYEDPTKPREMCTLWMISEPHTARAQECFSATKTTYIIVDSSIDGPQFKANQAFSKIYESDSLSIFSRLKY